MERNEIPENVVELFRQFEWKIRFPTLSEAMAFDHPADLFNLIQAEKAYWGSRNTGILASIHAHWAQLADNVDGVLRYVASNAQHASNLVRSTYTAISQAKWPNVHHESPLAAKALSDPNRNPQRWAAFLVGAGLSVNDITEQQLRNRESMFGFVEGAAYSSPGLFSDFLSDAQTQLQKSFEERHNEAQKLHTTVNEVVQSLRTAFKQNDTEINSWRADKIKNLDSDLSAIRQRFVDLENLYIEKLKLEAPAQYWQKRASRMRKVGFGWLSASIACVVFGAVILWHYFVAPGVFIDAKDIASQVALTAAKEPTVAFLASAKNIRALIGFSVIVSLSFFLLRMLIRLTVSAFHLSIDAAEREQLTYLYLSLMDKGQKDGKDIIAGEDRQIILRSLFSRADTGLLAGDSSPTMPGVDTITALKGGGK